MIETPVLIAGGGPVGLTLGHELCVNDIAFLLVERNQTTTRAPKMDLTNSRTMELYRRLGLSEIVRQIGCPPSSPFDVIWVTSQTGRELHRFRYPSQDDMWDRINAATDGSLPAEPAVRVSQIVLEPALRNALVDRPGADVRYGWALESLEQDDEGVTALLRSTTGETELVRSQYLIGCDGAGSTVRRDLGIDLDGSPGVRQSYMVHFRSSCHDRRTRPGAGPP